MRYAVYVPNFDTFGSVRTLVELAQAAERDAYKDTLCKRQALHEQNIEPSKLFTEKAAESPVPLGRG
jgi:hypothetical protein